MADTRSTYDGTVNANNERHGWGVYQVVFAGRYEGEWRNGFKHGNGSVLTEQVSVTTKTTRYSTKVIGKAVSLMEEVESTTP